MKILLVIDTYDTNNNGTSISALRASGFAGVLKFRIVTQYRSPSNP